MDDNTLPLMKRCNRCGQEKPLKEFRRTPNTRSGFTQPCGKCACQSRGKRVRSEQEVINNKRRNLERYYAKTGRKLGEKKIRAPKTPARRKASQEVVSLEGEVWRPVIEADGYEVSNLGRIKNVRMEQLLKGNKSSDGYMRVALAVSQGKYVGYRVHRLVAAAFLQPLNKEDIVDHLNRIRDDNRLENLRIVDPKGNAANRDSAVSIGLVRQIIALSQQGLNEEDIVRRMRTAS